MGSCLVFNAVYSLPIDDVAVSLPSSCESCDERKETKSIQWKRIKKSNQSSLLPPLPRQPLQTFATHSFLMLLCSDFLGNYRWLVGKAEKIIYAVLAMRGGKLTEKILEEFFLNFIISWTVSNYQDFRPTISASSFCPPAWLLLLLLQQDFKCIFTLILSRGKRVLCEEHFAGEWRKLKRRKNH